jgi:hypothetical protein
LLLVRRDTEIFIFFQAAMSPAVRPELVPAFEACPDEIRIRFGKSTGKEDRGFDADTIATFQE